MAEFSGSFIKYGSEQSVHVLGANMREVLLENTNIEGVLYSADIFLALDQHTRSVGRMIIKDQGEERMYLQAFYDSWPEILLEKHAWLQSHGFPVVPTFRTDVINNRILMTDVSENGRKRIIDKHNSLRRKQDLKNRNDVKRELLSIPESAYAEGNGILLGLDAYAVVVDEQGMGKVMLLDLGQNTWRIINHRSVSPRPYMPVTLGDAKQNIDYFLRLTKIGS